MKLYNGQTNFKLTLLTGSELTEVESAVIKYKKPDGTAGEWAAQVVGEGVEKTFTNADNDLDIGKWQVWPYVVFNSGLISIGEAKQLIIYEQGK